MSVDRPTFRAHCEETGLTGGVECGRLLAAQLSPHGSIDATPADRGDVILTAGLALSGLRRSFAHRAFPGCRRPRFRSFRRSPTAGWPSSRSTACGPTRFSRPARPTSWRWRRAAPSAGAPRRSSRRNTLPSHISMLTRLRARGARHDVGRLRAGPRADPGADDLSGSRAPRGCARAWSWARRSSRTFRDTGACDTFVLAAPDRRRRGIARRPGARRRGPICCSSTCPRWTSSATRQAVDVGGVSRRRCAALTPRSGASSRALPADTTIIVTADHGGHGRGAQRRQLAGHTIPWVIAGPSTARGKQLRRHPHHRHRRHRGVRPGRGAPARRAGHAGLRSVRQSK